jgi:uroporphyrinogen-III synthase
MPTAEQGALAGLRVLVTRPVHQALPLIQLIENAGAVAVPFPTIEITPPTDPQPLTDISTQLDQFDFALFVSPNAVTRAFAVLRALPPTLQVVCIGGGSAKALSEHGVREALVPTRNDSEGVLELPSLQQLKDKRVAIFRGEGGRELLGEQLRARGARVTYIECYRRVRPQTDGAALARRFLQSGIDVVTVTSADALRNLNDMIGQPAAALLARTPLVVVSERLRDIAHELGLQGPVLVSPPSDEGIVKTIGAWRTSQKKL